MLSLSIRISGSHAQASRLSRSRYFPVFSILAQCCSISFFFLLQIHDAKRRLCLAFILAFVGRPSDLGSCARIVCVCLCVREKERERDEIFGTKSNFIRYASVERKTRSLHFSRFQANGPFWFRFHREFMQFFFFTILCLVNGTHTHTYTMCVLHIHTSGYFCIEDVSLIASKFKQIVMQTVYCVFCIRFQSAAIISFLIDIDVYVCVYFAYLQTYSIRINTHACPHKIKINKNQMKKA